MERVFLKNLNVSHVGSNCSAFFETLKLINVFTRISIGSYLEPAESTPNPHTMFLCYDLVPDVVPYPYAFRLESCGHSLPFQLHTAPRPFQLRFNFHRGMKTVSRSFKQQKGRFS